MRKFKKRIDNLEVRSCNDQLLSFGRHTRAEIVRWYTDYCVLLAYWERDEDGFDLKFVGTRPFGYITTADELESFWLLAQYGQDNLK